MRLDRNVESGWKFEDQAEARCRSERGTSLFCWPYVVWPLDYGKLCARVRLLRRRLILLRRIGVRRRRRSTSTTVRFGGSISHRRRRTTEPFASLAIPSFLIAGMAGIATTTGADGDDRAGKDHDGERGKTRRELVGDDSVLFRRRRWSWQDGGVSGDRRRQMQ